MKFRIDFIENNKFLLKLAIAIFLITFFILFIFEPFGDIKHGFLITGIIRVLSYAFTASLSFYLAEKYLKSIFIKYVKRTIYTPVFWYFFEIFIITIAIFICRTFWVGIGNTTLASFFLVLYRVMVIGAIPLAFVLMLLYSFNKSSIKAQEIIFKSKDKNPKYLKLFQESIVYLKSDENYTTIYFKDNKSLKSKILRGSLSYFETSLTLPFFRIHRAYIVNLNTIKHIDINSQGGTVILNTEDVELRISRTFVSDFKLHWDALNPV